jgi:TPR repeat protein
LAGRIEEKRRSFEKALEYYSKGGEMGSFNWTRLMLEHYSRDDDDTREEAIRRMEQLATQGYVPAIMSMGNIYAAGKYGVEKNLEIAARYFHQAANKDDPGGCSMYAFALSKGVGVARDIPAAKRFFLHAIQFGDVRAMFNYAMLLLEEDEAQEAIGYLRMAADKEMLQAQFKLAECAEKGIGIRQDPQLAIHNYRLVVSNPNPPGDRWRVQAQEALRRLTQT